MTHAYAHGATTPAAAEVPALAVPAEGSAVHIAWSAFWRSRLLIWVAGCLAMALLGSIGYDKLIDPSGVTSALGKVGNVLTAPAVRWDSVWYLQIADHGYQTARETAFFPLYPLLAGAGSWLTGSAAVSGVAISLAALFAGLLIVQRLTELELGVRASSAAVNLLAFTPMAVFFSAMYSEALFLALSAGTFLAARYGRWRLAGVVGALAAMTRMTGVLLVVPVVILFLYGPRSDAPPADRARRLRPRYRFAPQLLWAALIPCGVVAFLGYLALRGFNVSVPLHAEQQFWARHFVQPLAVIRDGAVSAWNELRLATSWGTTSGFERQSLIQLAALAISAGSLVGVFRRLPFAYGAYASCVLMVSLSSEASGKALVSYDRYAAVVFPLYMWAGAWAAERRSVRKLVLLSGLLAVGFAVEFATWRFVA